jgi:hypothetical protein
MMTRKQRILDELGAKLADRVPLLGGFLISPGHYSALAGVTEAEFFADPQRCAIAANRALDVDGLILLRLPEPGPEGYRGNYTEEQFYGYAGKFKGPEDVLAYVTALPSPRDELALFDRAAWGSQFVLGVAERQRQLGDIVWMPTQWDVIHPSFERWLSVFGYVNYLEFLVLYPEAADRLFAWQVEVCRAKAEIVVDVYRQLDIPPLIHIGTDICGRNGPLVAPEWLRAHYFPHVRRGLEPVVEAGFTTVWHSDGVITPIVDDILACGVSGFQGFQWEYGLRLEDLVSKRTLTGDPLTIFAGPSTARSLSTDQVRQDVEYVVKTARGRCRLFLLPANDLLPDVPVEVVLEMYRHAAGIGQRTEHQGNKR